MSNPNPIVSAIICTHNRAEYVRDALDSLVRQDCPSDTYETIIVDNASSDNTSAVVAGFVQQSRIPIVYVHESSLGLSFARNAGAEVAKGEILAYLDDDAVAAVNWIPNIARAFSEIPSSHVGVVGGKIDLRWDCGVRPAWLPQELDGYLGKTKFTANIPVELPLGENPNGGNLCVHKGCFDKVGGFSTRLGRQGGNLLSNDEVDFCNRARRAGYEIWYAPGVVVQHRVPLQRATRRYLLERTYWQGISNAAMLGDTQPVVRDPLWKCTLGLIRDMLRYCAKAVGFSMSCHQADAFAQMCYASSRWGYYLYDIKMRGGLT